MGGRYSFSSSERQIEGREEDNAPVAGTEGEADTEPEEELQEAVGGRPVAQILVNVVLLGDPGNSRGVR
jgi:hypothetical protein